MYLDPNVSKDYFKLNTDLNYGLFTSDFASWDSKNNIYKKRSVGFNLDVCNSTCNKITYISGSEKNCKRICMDHIGEIIKEVPFTQCLKKYSYYDWLSLYDFIDGTDIPDLYFLDLTKKINKDVLKKCKNDMCDKDGLCDYEFEKILDFVDDNLSKIKEVRKEEDKSYKESYQDNNGNNGNNDGNNDNNKYLILVVVLSIIFLCLLSIIFIKRKMNK